MHVGDKLSPHKITEGTGLSRNTKRGWQQKPVAQRVATVVLAKMANVIPGSH